jgi:hypothetical protein
MNNIDSTIENITKLYRQPLPPELQRAVEEYCKREELEKNTELLYPNFHIEGVHDCRLFPYTFNDKEDFMTTIKVLKSRQPKSSFTHFYFDSFPLTPFIPLSERYEHIEEWRQELYDMNYLTAIRYQCKMRKYLIRQVIEEHKEDNKNESKHSKKGK